MKCFNYVLTMHELFYPTYPSQIALRGHSKTTLTRFWPFLTTYLPLVDIFEGISILLGMKIYISLTFPQPPTYLIMST